MLLLAIILICCLSFPVFAEEENTEATDSEEETAPTEPPTPEGWFDWLIENMDTEQFGGSINNEYIDAMGDEVYRWYTIIRNYIALPLLILSYASCGFRFLFNGFMSSPVSSDALKRQMLYATIALALLILLPHILGAARDVFGKNAWNPAFTALIT